MRLVRHPGAGNGRGLLEPLDASAGFSTDEVLPDAEKAPLE